MQAPAFENQLFDHWLNQKSQEILSKMEKEKVTTEDYANPYLENANQSFSSYGC